MMKMYWRLYGQEPGAAATAFALNVFFILLSFLLFAWNIWLRTRLKRQPRSIAPVNNQPPAHLLSDRNTRKRAQETDEEEIVAAGIVLPSWHQHPNHRRSVSEIGGEDIKLAVLLPSRSSLLLQSGSRLSLQNSSPRVPTPVNPFLTPKHSTDTLEQAALDFKVFNPRICRRINSGYFAAAYSRSMSFQDPLFMPSSNPLNSKLTADSDPRLQSDSKSDSGIPSQPIFQFSSETESCLLSLPPATPKRERGEKGEKSDSWERQLKELNDLLDP